MRGGADAHNLIDALVARDMFELLKLFPRWPLAISVAGWIFFFVLQIAFLSIAAWGKYTPPTEPA